MMDMFLLLMAKQKNKPLMILMVIQPILIQRVM